MREKFSAERPESILEADSAVRLGGSFRRLLDCLPDLGRTYIQGRNAGGGIGRAVPEFCPVVLGEEESAVDPDLGIGFSLNQWIAVHGGLLPFDTATVPALDFEFACFISGLSFLEMPGIGEAGSIQKFTSKFADSRIGANELLEWRESIEGQVQVCSCCQKASERRARTPKEHPLYEICRQASSSEMEFRCRLQANHVDMIVDMTPSRLAVTNGYLVVMPASSDAAWHVDMRMVHSLRVSETVIDGQKCGQLEVFDMFGNRNFQITCGERGIAGFWEAICRGDFPRSI